jgi:pimeloyl-ACP methyl ester carboxylesterase
MALPKTLRRIFAVTIFILFVALALCAAGVVPYFLAVRISTIPYLAVSSVFCFAVLLLLGGWISAKVWQAARPGRFATVSTAVLVALFAAALYFVILRPHPLRLAETLPYNDTKNWQLSTGSRIAYSEFDPAAGIPVKPEPIVFLHGGPGLRNAPFDREAYGSFAADGFRVILYDQVGSGLSGFLPHIRDYTIARDVEDLEAIRKELGAERMILIGHSWGSTLAASYMAKYPERVSKVVFHSPGDIWNLGSANFDLSRTDGGQQSFPPLRMIAGFFLQIQNPEAAENLLPQREAEELFATGMGSVAGTLVCKNDSGKLPPVFAEIRRSPDNLGFSPYVGQQKVLETGNSGGDPHSALRNNRTPAILLFGECNYIPWSGALDYRKTFSNLKIYYIPRAGHYIQFEQPELMHRVILAFLLGQPDAILPYTSDADPRTAQP